MREHLKSVLSQIKRGNRAGRCISLRGDYRTNTEAQGRKKKAEIPGKESYEYGRRQEVFVLQALIRWREKALIKSGCTEIFHRVQLRDPTVRRELRRGQKTFVPEGGSRGSFSRFTLCRSLTELSVRRTQEKTLIGERTSLRDGEGCAAKTN